MTDAAMDIDAMLDGAMEDAKNEKSRGSQRSPARSNRSRSRSRDRKRSRSRSKDRRRSRSRDRGDRRRSRSRSRDRRRRRSGSRDRRRSRSRDRGGYRRRSRTRSRDRRRSPPRRRDRRSPVRRSPRRSPPRSRLPGPERRDVMPFNPRHSPPKNAKLELSAEERDQRTLLIMQIARDTRPRDLEEFFSSVGAVRDVRIITDSRTGRSKGICYVEFWDEESVPLGLALNGQRLMGAPLQIQRTCAERNRIANSSVASTLGFVAPGGKGPAQVLVENLHPKIDDKMLGEVFDSFGRIDKLDVEKDMNGENKGFAVITFRNADEAQKACEQLNDFEVAGRKMRLTIKQEPTPQQSIKKEEASIHQRSLDDVGDRQGFSLGAGGRQQLMAKLAQGTGSGMELTASAQMAAQHAGNSQIPSIATQCFLLSNMFDPAKETEPQWDHDIREDVIEQCACHGGALHVFVDKGSQQGNVYVKCPSIAIAHQAVSALHGRWFSGKVITANYVPVNSYHDLFPDAVHARLPLSTRNVVPPPQVPMMTVPQQQVTANGYGYGMIPGQGAAPAQAPYGGAGGYYQ
ncbi:hypothetical protein L3Y34_005517 [Caenorhabditis briggsae]|uniref:RRM domain-containing protein n=1 Tax=Caenorhabditis briggsae TaxID=6238 RepID=A0AAE9AJJ6_CAEBR|nr:hypothetical protein L3Y34_005517 [Caenorhabditis briggsae]